jgi:methylenetetrahydrofolate--tRNA-(uracil-5-)-methyltransferase
MHKSITIIGAGLAGSEAALQLVTHGFKVTVYEAKPVRLDAYKLDTAAELVCNNSFGELDLTKPRGMLLAELEAIQSEIIKIANKNALEDPRFFAVDVPSFSSDVSKALSDAGVTVVRKELQILPEERPLIIASGPLTSDSLAQSISDTFNIKHFKFSDACCPIVDISTVDIKNPNVIKKSNDLYELVVEDIFFDAFYVALLHGSPYQNNHSQQSFDFEKIYTIEALAKQGADALLKERFVIDNGKKILLLRRESALNNGFIIAGCTTMLNNNSQRIAFSTLPGLSNCEFIRYGRIHRNTYFKSPGHLDCFYNVIGNDVYLIGQISGIDGYTAAISSGYIAAQRIIQGEALKPYPSDSMMGALARYVSNTKATDFQPMGASFSLFS